MKRGNDETGKPGKGAKQVTGKAGAKGAATDSPKGAAADSPKGAPKIGAKSPAKPVSKAAPRTAPKAAPKAPPKATPKAPSRKPASKAVPKASKGIPETSRMAAPGDVPKPAPAAPITSEEAIVQHPVDPQVVANAVQAAEARVSQPSDDELHRLLGGAHGNPHGVLGAHPAERDGVAGVIVRTMMPVASGCDLVLGDGTRVPMLMAMPGPSNLFEAFIAGASLPLQYRLRYRFDDGASWERIDPYRFLPTVGDVDLHLFNEGTHRRLWTVLGAHIREIDGVRGTSFAVWAPNARRVSVIGPFCGWDGRLLPMRLLGSSGVWELFVPELDEGTLYKYEILTQEGALRVKTDPYAFKLEQSPGTASIVTDEHAYGWSDDEWITGRASRDWHREPMSIYEVHLGSWARVPEEDNRVLTYREIATALADHVTSLGFTHVELLPVMEHPFYGSWGYQVSGYYAPTSRYGTPDDFKYLVDTLHAHGIGVILDWVPAHFPKDDFALRRFDGTALYEHDDPRLGEHPDWGTLIFNYGRSEVRNFLVANALYWLREYHIDGLRVDAVASMLYLDYSRKPGEWMRNRLGGRENLDAIDFLRQFNDVIRSDAPGCFTVAEESTAWPGVTTETAHGGLGFTFKWNMGWMHDTLQYFGKDPIHRRHHHDQLTFAMTYEFSERFVMPLSHDEVVHLKGSLLAKMAGDEWQRLANLRLMLAYMFTRPGKKLLFMGTELAPYGEWNHDRSLDWNLLREDPRRAGFRDFVGALGHLYRDSSEFWRQDTGWDGFGWIDIADRDNSVMSYFRRDGDRIALVVLNLTPVPREHYRIGAPVPGTYRQVLSTDDARWGGAGIGIGETVETEASPFHGFEQSVVLTLPPLGAIVLQGGASA
jgi:1,4-alpha-glucan branching enzyme